MTIAGHYIDDAKLSARVGAKTYAACFDDTNSGTVNAQAVAQVIQDAEAQFDGFMRGVYPIPLSPVPNQAVRICLDLAEAYTYLRNVEAARRDPDVILKRAREEMTDIRKGFVRLDVEGPPEPGANQGGEVHSGDPEHPTPPPKAFGAGTGWF